MPSNAVIIDPGSFDKDAFIEQKSKKMKIGGFAYAASAVGLSCDQVTSLWPLFAIFV